MTEELGMVNSIRMCSSGGEEPTAFVCGNTMIAKGIYSAMQILGRNIRRMSRSLPMTMRCRNTGPSISGLR